MAATRVDDASLTTFTINVNGQALSGEFRLEYLDIRRMINRISFAEIAFIDGAVDEQNFILSESDDLAFGGEVEIYLGYNTDEESIFKGVIVKQQIQVTRGGQSRLLLNCRDASYRMCLTERSAHYASVSDSDVISLLASNHGINADVETTSDTHLDVAQWRTSDWDFMLQRAERNGLVVLTKDGELSIVSVRSGPSKGQIVYGRNVLSAELEIDAQHQYESTKSRAWSSANQEKEEQEGSAALTEPGRESSSTMASQAGGREKCLAADGDVTASTLLNWANAAIERQQLAKIIGTITLQGSHDIQCGDWVDLEGFGQRMNGQAFVGGIMHAVSRGNWLTTLQIGLNPQWHMQQFSNPGPQDVLSTTNSNLHIAKVVGLSEDPDGGERIQVKVIALGEDQEGIWARLASKDAGSERGWVIRPEIDDEVIVGFIDGDAAQPVILGSLYSSAHATPIPADNDDNHEKGWVTRSGMKFIFNDDTITLTIETPNGNTITVDDDAGGISIQDENDNAIVLDSSGITMTSASDINIEARGDINVSAVNLKQDAQAEVKLNGSAGATLESGGSTTVKGSIVQIN